MDTDKTSMASVAAMKTCIPCKISKNTRNIRIIVIQEIIINKEIIKYKINNS